MNKIRQGDTVEVLAGEDRGKRGTVHSIFPKKNQVIVSGINLIKKHQKRTMRVQTQTGIVEREGPIPISRVAVVCQNCSKPTRVRFRIAGTGEKLRMCQHCGEPVAASK